ncbi:MAG: flagellar assembly protein FliW [Oligoflexia bacterium]|nr:flagellar assembly protein FliW [Oligoflexia bacterium]
MEIQTSRFGVVNIQENDVLTLTDPILGFPDLKKFVILEDPDDLVFAWFQSCENKFIAFAILEPELFAADYKVKLGKNDKEALQVAEPDVVRVFNIVTIPDDVTQMTANLKAPLVVNVAKRLVKQVVTQENDHPIRHPIFNELQARLSQGALTQVTPTSTPAAVAPPKVIVHTQKQEDTEAKV